jgi:DNA-binding LytR/AlgR family response regulator
MKDGKRYVFGVLNLRMSGISMSVMMTPMVIDPMNPVTICIAVSEFVVRCISVNLSDLIIRSTAEDQVFSAAIRRWHRSSPGLITLMIDES